MYKIKIKQKRKIYLILIYEKIGVYIFQIVNENTITYKLK